MNKKGKETFKMATGLTEPVRRMIISEPRMWTAGEFLYNAFDNGKVSPLYQHEA